MKTFIKWFGNKTRYQRNIIANFPLNYNTYIEPFVGSGAIFLKVQPTKWIINDMNTDLMNVWVHIKEALPSVSKSIKLFSRDFVPLDREGKIELCKSTINKLNAKTCIGPKRSAYYLLMKYCVFLGLLLSKNNVFYFRGLEQNYNDKNYIPIFSKDSYIENLKHISKYLNESNGKIVNSDYKQILKLAKQNDFVFMDPPYIEDREYQFKYNKEENLDTKFTNELYKECKKLDRRKVKWMMTQADTPIIRLAFKEYYFQEMKVYRAIRKAYTTELIIRNYTT